MPEAVIRDAHPQDAARLNDGLAALSADLGDDHPMTAATLARLCFGAAPAAHGLIAEDGGTLLGVALYSPVVSTSRGGAGVFLADLWVSEDARGRGLGPRLIGAVARRAEERWGAVFLRLAVYHTSPRARAFYDRLGFAPALDQTVMTLAGPAFAAVKGA